ncbi:hypothetical protein AGR8A_Lc20043 [Agrobacterium fabrum str. J-07]|nr:hypothetical protein AGR8A_Lc20043 [Agrobacterium fabrum str. J-07]
MNEVGVDHMLRPNLVRQPYFLNSCHASPDAGFLEGRIAGSGCATEFLGPIMAMKNRGNHAYVILGLVPRICK